MDTQRQYDARQQAESVLADPDETLIRLYASAIRLTWSPAEERRRQVASSAFRPLDDFPVAVKAVFGNSAYE